MDHPTTERLSRQSIVPSYHIQDCRILRAYCTDIYVYKLWAAASLGKSLKYHWKMDSLRYITREVMRAHRNRRQKCICTMGSEAFKKILTFFYFTRFWFLNTIPILDKFWRNVVKSQVCLRILKRVFCVVLSTLGVDAK